MRSRGYNSSTSWVAAFACSVIGFLIPIPMRIAGLLFIIIIDRYETSRMYATIPIMVFGIIRSLTGPFIGYLGQVFGLRAVTLVGCLLASIGIGACFFAEDIIAVTVFLGFIFGTGFGLGSTLVPEILKQHFSKDIGLVNGMFLTGSCLGALIMPPVVKVFIDEYGDSGMFLLLAGIMLHSVPVAILLKDPKNKEYHARIGNLRELDNRIANSTEKVHPEECAAFILRNGATQKSEVEDDVSTVYKYENENDNSINSELVLKPSEKKVQIIKKAVPKDNDFNADSKSLDLDNINASCNHNVLNSKCNHCGKNEEFIKLNPKYSLPNHNSNNISAIDDPEIENCEIKISPEVPGISESSKGGTVHKLVLLFLDPSFYLTMTIQSFHAFIMTLNWTILIDFSRDKGISPSDSLYFLMFLPLSEIIGSLSLNWISDRGYMTRTKYCVVCHLILSGIAISIVFAYTYALMMTAVLLFGIFSGSLGAIFPGMIHEFIEEDLQGLALASRFVLYAFLCLTKSPITGYFRGTLGSYEWVYFIIAICSATCGFLAMFTPVLAARRKKRKSKTDIELKS